MSLTNAIRELWWTIADLFDPYRPELHYMRGPGPKWHAKRTGSAAKAAGDIARTGPALREIAEVRA